MNRERIKFALVGLAIVMFAAILPISGITIGTRLWRAGGAWAPRVGLSVGPEELKIPATSLDLLPKPDGTAARFAGLSGDLEIEGEIEPARPRIGRMLVKVRPTLAIDSVAMSQAIVTVWLAQEDRWLIRSPALNSPSDRGLYVSSIEIDEPGDWRMMIVVSSQQRASGFDLSFPVAGRARGGAAARGATLVYLGAFAVVAGGVARIVFIARRRRAGLPSSSRPSPAPSPKHDC